MQSALKCYQKYSSGSEKYNYKPELEKCIEDTLPASIKTKCPIKKIIRTTNNILKFNSFECSLLCWLLRKSFFLNQNINQITYKDIFQIKLFEEDYDKRVFLYLLLNGYHVKNHFFINGAEIDIDPVLFVNITSFDEIYSNWKPEKSLKSVSLGQINKIFESWNNTKSVKTKVDYNKVVDKILQLSKTYNVGIAQQTVSVKQTERGAKKRKLNQDLKSRYNDQKSRVYDNSPMKNSGSNKIPWFQDQKNNNQLNSLRRSTRTLNRSIFEVKQDRYDLNPNQSLFRSFRSKDSGQDNLFNSLKNTNNNGAFFNLNNSLVNYNNQSFGLNKQSGGVSRQSIGFGNMFRSCVQSDIMVSSKTRKPRHKKTEIPPVKLRPTTSHEQLK